MVSKRVAKMKAKKISAPRTTREDFAKKICRFVDKHGVIVGQGESPVSAFLSMKYEKKGVAVYVHVASSPHSNGSTKLRVVVNRKTVFKAHGSYVAQIGPMTVEIDKPGTWENIFKK